MQKNIIITGHGRHGKDTMAEYLRDKYHLSFSSSSWMACQLFIYDKINADFGYQTVEECFDDRANQRKLWFDMIVEYNTPDLARLGKDIFAAHPVYCGIRNKDELDALRQQRDVTVIWVDRSKHKPLEDISSMNITEDDADYVIDNNSSLDDFYRHIDDTIKNVIKK